MNGHPFLSMPGRSSAIYRVRFWEETWLFLTLGKNWIYYGNSHQMKFQVVGPGRGSCLRAAAFISPRIALIAAFGSASTMRSHDSRTQKPELPFPSIAWVLASHDALQSVSSNCAVPRRPRRRRRRRKRSITHAKREDLMVSYFVRRLLIHRCYHGLI